MTVAQPNAIIEGEFLMAGVCHLFLAHLDGRLSEFELVVVLRRFRLPMDEAADR